MSDKEKTYTVAEERLNILTHAIGIIGGLAVSAIFIKTVVEKGGDACGCVPCLRWTMPAVGCASSTTRQSIGTLPAATPH